VSEDGDNDNDNDPAACQRGGVSLPRAVVRAAPHRRTGPSSVRGVLPFLNTGLSIPARRVARWTLAVLLAKSDPGGANLCRVSLPSYV
jgi:hypothetical protein